MPDVWEHDMFDGNQVKGKAAFSLGQSSNGKILVSNLDFGVNDSDIQVKITKLTLDNEIHEK